ncbi:MAG: RagB/SusD family nutrient uptake outer membrane protein [Bacteroidota bacterium]
MKIKVKSLIVTLFLAAVSISCGKDWLEVRPADSVDQYSLANEDGIDALLIGAYSMLDGVSSVSYFGWESAASNWLYSEIRGLIANKGTDAGDSWDGQPIKSYTETATNTYISRKWEEVYEAIARCNTTIMVINQALEDGTISQDQAGLFLEQARALRGWYHFEAWRMWEMIPYIDETTDQNTLTNTEDIREKIITDLQEGAKLPDDMDAIGRFNGTVSKVLLAKAFMQMYHDYPGALVLLADVKTNGTKPDGSPIGLAPTYGEIFDIVNRNGIEAVYTVQYSVNDGSGGWNGGYGEALNFPYKSGASPAGCCSFFQPTQEYVNSFRTSGGLPLPDNSYNLDPVENDQGLRPSDPFVEDAGPIDPRLDWSVGRRGIPYWDWGVHTGSDWVRDQTYAGPYSPKKQVYKKSQEGIYTDVSSWTSGFTANGYRMIRYADVLLLLAECQIETGDLAGALENINAVRARAANPDGFVKEADGVSPAANYVISLYPSFSDADYARRALRMERKLELGMEGHRWFDLNRWGIAVEELNRILDYEKSMPWGNAMYYGAVVGPEDVTYPIPQKQIDLSSGRLKQNR